MATLVVWISMGSWRDKLCTMSRKPRTIAELVTKAGKAGGKARAKALTPQRRQEIARQGGLAGGLARAKKLSGKKRSEIAQKAAQKRWAKKAGKSNE
jgi:general stress protein YciG